MMSENKWKKWFVNRLPASKVVKQEVDGEGEDIG